MIDNKNRTKRCVNNLTNLHDFLNMHSGSKCFIVGAGPSLQFLNLNSIHTDIVISINSSILLMPWSNNGDVLRRFWISSDSLCSDWDYFWKKVVRSFCTKLVKISWKKKWNIIQDFAFRFFSHRDPIKSTGYEGLCGNSSVLSAIDLAMMIGCNRIVLLGVDHRMLHGRSHFWQFYPIENQPRRQSKDKNYIPSKKQQTEMFNRNIPYLKFFKVRAESIGTAIYNCSSISDLDIFPKITLNEALSL